MAHEVTLGLREAVARFFPVGSGYDFDKADQLIRWLRLCGYEILPEDQTAIASNAEDTEPNVS